MEVVIKKVVSKRIQEKSINTPGIIMNNQNQIISGDIYSDIDYNVSILSRCMLKNSKNEYGYSYPSCFDEKYDARLLRNVSYCLSCVLLNEKMKTSDYR